MDHSAYIEMAAVQDRHWWFVGRRAILGRLIGSLDLPPQAEILEVGCGMGGNVPLLRGFGRLTAVEADAYARGWTAERLGQPVLDGALPDRLPPLAQKFDLICLLDVLEHVDDDAGSLAALRPLLAAGGRILVTVPAYAWLWSAHDRQLHHRRRYTRRRLLQVAAAAGLQARRSGYFNAILLPLAVAARLLARGARGEAMTGSGLPSPMLNGLLRRMFAAEAPLLGRFAFPFGLSVFAVLHGEGD